MKQAFLPALLLAAFTFTARSAEKIEEAFGLACKFAPEQGPSAPSSAELRGFLYCKLSLPSAGSRFAFPAHAILPSPAIVADAPAQHSIASGAWAAVFAVRKAHHPKFTLAEYELSENPEPPHLILPEPEPEPEPRGWWGNLASKGLPRTESFYPSFLEVRDR